MDIPMTSLMTGCEQKNNEAEKMKRWKDEKSHLSPNKIPATHISNSYWKVKRVNKKWVHELTNLKIKE